MVELSSILASGDIPVINAQDLQEDGASLLALIVLLQAQFVDGINLPEVAAADAEDNSIFYNTDANLVCWKSRSGQVFRFNMRLL